MVDHKAPVFVAYRRSHCPEYTRVFGAGLVAMERLVECERRWLVGTWDAGEIAFVDRPVARGIRNNA